MMMPMSISSESPRQRPRSPKSPQSFRNSMFPNQLVTSSPSADIIIPPSSSFSGRNQMSFRPFLPWRTHPFLYNMVKAILGFRRLAKLVRQRSGISKKRTDNRADLQIKVKILQTEKILTNVKFGRVTLLEQRLHQLRLEEEEEKERKEERETNSKNAPLPSSKENKELTKVERLAILNEKVKEAARFRSRIMFLNGEPTTSSNLYEEIRNHSHAHAHANDVSNSNDIEDVMMKNYSLETSQVIDFNGTTTKKSSRHGGEYLAGTSIYFGAKIALKGYHGGYMSFHDPQNVRASAHKILPTASFLLLNSDDLSDVSLVKYGDAVWLQAGDYTVLGAFYGGITKPDSIESTAETKKTREIRPGLINCRKANIFKAQQYGRWILLNRENPIETIGKPVLHQDHIILEQEWYFLSSSTPYESGMYKTVSNLDNTLLNADNSIRKHDLFQPSIECTWKIYLVSLPKESFTGERKRQRLLHQANQQIDTSRRNRLDRGQKLVSDMNAIGKDNMTDNRKKNQSNTSPSKKSSADIIKQKLDPSTSEETLLKLYQTKAVQNWEPASKSIKNLANIYGHDSKVVQERQLTLKIRGERSQLDEEALALQIKEAEREVTPSEEYWSVASTLLVDSHVVSHLPHVMNPYYNKDLKKKVTAIRLLQRVCRAFIATKFNYNSAMKAADRNVEEFIHQQVFEHQKRSLPGDNSSPFTSRNGFRRAPSSVRTFNRTTSTTLSLSNPAIKDMDGNRDEGFTPTTKSASGSPNLHGRKNLSIVAPTTSPLISNSISDVKIAERMMERSFSMKLQRSYSAHGTRSEKPTSPSSADLNLSSTISMETMQRSQHHHHHHYQQQHSRPWTSQPSLRTGVKFLQAMSKTPEIYSGVKVIRRSKA